MFSKKNISLVMSIVFLLTSCTPKVGEAPPEPEQTKMEGTQCLSSLQPVIEKFIEGTATPEAVASGWDCASTAIKKFKKYVYGRASDRFEADELAAFLRENFLAPNSAELSTELRTEFMRIKQLFLGGSIEYVTRAELDKIINMLGELKSISLHLNPYMKLISQKWSIASSGNVQEDIRYFENASDEIQNAARSLANMIVENNQTYELDHFSTFIREFSIFVNQDWPIAGQIDKLMPVIKKVKKAVSGGDQDKIGPTEWRSFVLLGVRGYLQYLRYFYFIKSASDTGSGIRLGYLARSVEDLLGAFQDLLEQKPVDPSCGTVKRSNGTREVLSCISKQEVTDIMLTFSDMWKEFRVSEKLVSEAMKLKKVVFGGSENSINSRDFERGKNKVSGLKGIVENFMPYYAVYSLEWDHSNFSHNAAQQFFKQAQDSLQLSATELGTLLEDSYNMESLVGLLTEIDRLYPKDKPEEQLAVQITKYLPIIKDVKNIVFSENDTYIKKEQWGPFLKYAGRFYGSFLYHNYFLKNENYGTSQFLESFKKLSDQVIAVVKDIVTLKKNQIITADELNLIAHRLSELELIPKDLDAKSIDQVVKVILNRILLPPELRLKGVRPNGITPVSIETLRTEMQIWYETEKFLYSQTSIPMKPVNLQTAIQNKLKESKISAELKTGLTEMALIVAGNVQQTIDSESRLVITNIVPPNYDMASVARLNLNRLISRTLIRGTTTSLDRLKKFEGVELKEAQVVFDLVKPVVVQMGLLDEKNTTFMESRFREANIFVAHSNGDSFMNFQETADIAGMIISGITVNNMFRKDVEAVCISPAKLKTDPVIAEACLRKIYLEQTANYMTATPEYLRFFKLLDLEDTAEFLQNILKAAGHVPNKQDTVRLVDADLAPHVIQYIEMTMAKYDTNKNGRINLAEAEGAFPSFKGILMELTKDQDLIKQKDLNALFYYILYYGQPPGGVKDFLFKWLPWRRDPEKWKVISADRKDLAAILGYIADQVAAAKEKQAKMISEAEEDEIRKSPEFDDQE
ncbi:hypothetical protein [Bdellovibrio sp. HCB337]|uniref:hypothetical protein n=1 Tax=Bdellovibrio sp. HCB337 TaxID=3394358 RepID=UPI0039A6CB68